MIPTMLTGDPWIEPNGKRGEWIFPTNAGLMTIKEIAAARGERVGSVYERFRRNGVSALFKVKVPSIQGDFLDLLNNKGE